MDGRSPGSRCDIERRLPGFPVAYGAQLTAYSCGGSSGVDPKADRTEFPSPSNHNMLGGAAFHVHMRAPAHPMGEARCASGALRICDGQLSVRDMSPLPGPLRSLARGRVSRPREDPH